MAPMLYAMPAYPAHCGPGRPAFAATEAMYGGSHAEMPHHVSVVVSDSTNAKSARRRASGCAKSSTSVKRVRSWRARAARRWASACSHFADSGMPRRIHSVKKPGRRPMRSEEHTSDSSHMAVSYAVFCLKKKKNTKIASITLNKKYTLINKRIQTLYQ